MDKNAVYHRSTPDMCFALDDETIVVLLKTGKDVDRVCIIHQDPFINELRRQPDWKGDSSEMELYAELEYQYLWRIELRPEYKRLQYYFRLYYGKEELVLYENKLCEAGEADKRYKQYFKYAWMNSSDIIRTPSWVSETVWYQIMPDRFSRDEEAGEDKKFRPWGSFSDPGWQDLFGGTIKGITSRLDYLKKLGISGIYLTPVFESPSNHKYNTTDYTRIDPDFGTEEDLIEMVSAAHERGIRVMLDAVFNHCGYEFGKWQDVLENGRNSPYFDWFFINNDNYTRKHYATDDGRYYSFSFWSVMPKLNTNNPEVADYFGGICENWVRRWGIDGIRFDVGDEVSHTFIRSLNARLKAINPDVFLLGEIWLDSINWLCGGEYDSVMNYPLTGAVHDFWKDSEMTSREFMYAINFCLNLYPEQVTRVLFNFLDTHDTSRAFESCSGNRDILLQKLAIIMTMPGSPCIYYGTEIAMGGKHNPYNRSCMPWNEIDAGKYADFSAEVTKLISLRTSYDVLRTGKTRFIPDDDKPRLIHYRRISDELAADIFINAGEPCRIDAEGAALYSRNFHDNILDTNGTLIILSEK